ncbi:hypothetical protein FRB94_009717 [Tulasnella sp. JGI-2019a]|nr:hypothetical protein FRB94_009717 [Tulasnella sp. JGI-2019a]
MAAPTIPKTHHAVTAVTQPKGFKIIEKPLPVVEDDEILVKVRTTSLNPTDWKAVFLFNMAKDESSVGCDFAGDVDSSSFKTIRPMLAFKYIKTRPQSVIVIPKDKISYQQAAPFGVALSTAVQALYHGLNLPPPWEPAKETFPILIWGGSTAIGIYAIKLAKLSGLSVLTTASPKNHDFLKELGADVVFDYKDPDAPRLIREWSHGGISAALDTVSDQDSVPLVAQALGDKGGKIITVLPPGPTGRSNVETSLTWVSTGIDPSHPESFSKMSDWYRRVPGYVSELNIMPIKIWEGGLDAIPEALEYMKAGKVSAQKIVVNVS